MKKHPQPKAGMSHGISEISQNRGLGPKLECPLESAKGGYIELAKVAICSRDMRGNEQILEERFKEKDRPAGRLLKKYSSYEDFR